MKTLADRMRWTANLPRNSGWFAALSWVHMLWVTSAYLRDGQPEFVPNGATAFHAVVWLTYSALYLAPAALLVWLLCLWKQRPAWLVANVAALATASCVVFIRADSAIFDLYRFHFNGFVLNLLATPGGIESLGGDGGTYRSVATIAAGHLLVQVLSWPLSQWMAGMTTIPVRWRHALAILLAAMAGERVAYAIADVRNDGQILDAARTYPYYGRTRFRTVAAKLGLRPAPRSESPAPAIAGGRLRYPLAEVAFSPVDKLPNVVIFAVESLRWDRLTEPIMPNVSRFAKRGQHFTRHYSSGNGTREGLFGLFYGLYGSYWQSFLQAQRSPLLMDRFQQLGYQFDLRTSARFSYPEFDKTLFAKVPASELHEAGGALAPAERDSANAAALIEFLRGRDRQRPFMSFFFMEATHARYDFPESAAIARPYLEEVDYANMSRRDLAPKIGMLLNRYTNAAHWIDQQIGRVLDEIERQGLLDNTIVIITGDHGEEFMEKGAWGHNSSFVEEQIHTPLVTWLPGVPHRVVETLTSHVDIGTTLLQALGAPKEAGGYSLGRNLLDESPRPFAVSSDWHSIAVMSADMKYRIAYTNRGTDHWRPTTLADVPFESAEEAGVLDRNRQILIDAIADCSRFAGGGKRVLGQAGSRPGT